MSVLIASLSELEDEGLAAVEGYPEGAATAHASAEREAERSHALRLLYTSEAAPEASSSLPILATAGDVREVVQYLKKKPAGVSVVEAMDDVKRRVFEPRKVAAYEFWGIVKRQGGDRLRLSALGWEFARKLAPEAEAYRAVLFNAEPYRAALEWMHGESQDLVTHTQVAAYWQKFYPSAAGQNQKAAESSVVCFFHLCQAAEIGTMTIGKRGQPARLRVEREELAAFIEGRTTPDPARRAREVGAGGDARPAHSPSDLATSDLATSDLSTSDRARHVAPTREDAEQKKQFLILCRRAAPLVGRLRTALELMNVESREVGGGDRDALPVSGEMFEAMRQCDAALVVVTPDDCRDDGAGGHTLDQNLLIELNSAFVLYDRRVVVLWNCPAPLPAALSSLRHFIVEGDELTWDAGVRLMQVVKEFQAAARAERRQTCRA